MTVAAGGVNDLVALLHTLSDEKMHERDRTAQ
jgi:hypothetical protein